MTYRLKLLLILLVFLCTQLLAFWLMPEQGKGVFYGLLIGMAFADSITWARESTPKVEVKPKTSKEIFGR